MSAVQLMTPNATALLLATRKPTRTVVLEMPVLMTTIVPTALLLPMTAIRLTTLTAANQLLTAGTRLPNPVTATEKRTPATLANTATAPPILGYAVAKTLLALAARSAQPARPSSSPAQAFAFPVRAKSEALQFARAATLPA